MTNALDDRQPTKTSKSIVKTVLMVFFTEGVVHKEFVPQEQTVNSTYYVKVFDRLRKRVVRYQNEFIDTWQLHHDNVPSHDYVRGAFLLQSCFVSDFFLFPRIKTALKGARFENINAIQTAVTKPLNEAPPVYAFYVAFRAWKNRWQKCVNARGKYFDVTIFLIIFFLQT